MTNDAGGLRLLGWSSGRPLKPRAELAEIRRDAKALRKLLAQQAKAAPMAQPAVAPWVPMAAPPTLTGVLQTLQGLIASFWAWLAPPPAPAPVQPPPQQPWPQPPGQPPAQPPAQPSGRAARFTVSSYNILGSSHTVPGADAAAYADGPTRTRWAADLLRQKGVEVVGFQEMAEDQARAFEQHAGKEYGLFPGSKRKGPLTSHCSIAWKKADFDLVKAYTVDMVSHKGRTQPSPVVRLRHKATGREVVFMNFHNAPGYHIGAQQGNRDEARAAQVALVNRVRRETGLEVVVTGDMNEKDAYFRDMTQQAGMHAANQRPGGQPPKVQFIDWIFGSAGVTFKGFVRERVGLERKISDHGFMKSEVAVR